jgi:Uri superfamily endonuclease
LGEFVFPAGDYVYLGSANGPGGLHARLGRHLHPLEKPHWHIDFLHCAAQVTAWLYVIRTATQLECSWSQLLSCLPEASLPAPGFGSRDCRNGCLAHLVHFDYLPLKQLHALLGKVQEIDLPLEVRSQLAAV